MRPAVFIAVLNVEISGFGGFLEASVVVGVSSAAVLHFVDEVVVVNHFMKQRSNHVFNGSGKSSSSNVDLMGCAILGDPSIIAQGEVTVGFGSALDGNGGS